MLIIKWAILLSIIVLPITAKSQILIGITGGLTKNYLSESTAGLSDTRLSASTGFGFRVPVIYKLNNGLCFSSGLDFLQKKYTVDRTGDFEGIYMQSVNSYLQVPLMIGMEKGFERVKFSFNAGGYGAYWLAGTVNGNIPNIFTVTDAGNAANNTTEVFNLTSYNEKYVFNKQRDRRYELGFTASAGMSYLLTKVNALHVEAAYFNALTDQQKEYMLNQNSRLNHTLMFTVGLFISLIK